MNPCSLTVGVSAFAAVISEKLSDEELAVAAAAFVQLGDSLATIAAQRACICAKASSKPAAVEVLQD